MRLENLYYWMDILAESREAGGSLYRTNRCLDKFKKI